MMPVRNAMLRVISHAGHQIATAPIAMHQLKWASRTRALPHHDS